MKQRGVEIRSESDVPTGMAGLIFRLLFFVFILSTLFDPADRVLGLKVPLFLACWVFTAWFCLNDRTRRSIPRDLFVLVFLMVLIPAASICYYYLVDGSEPYEGFLLLKSYLFMSFAVVIYITRIDAIKYLAVALVVLALAVVLLTVFVAVFPEAYLPTYLLGERLGIFSIDQGRDYGTGTKFFQMYFVTSPMLVVTIAYYFESLRRARGSRALNVILIVLSACAMFLAGTRNNMIIAVFLPIVLFLYYSKYRLGVAAIMAVVCAAFLYQFSAEIGAMFDPTEVSNSTKLVSLNDYASILGTDPVTFIFGRGLGAYEYWTGRGYYFVTELTFLENIRNFGAVMGSVMTLMLLYPVIYAFLLRPTYPEKPIIIAYAAFLVMSMTNPLFFSSMGMLILASVVAKIGLYEYGLKCRRAFVASFARPIESA